MLLTLLLALATIAAVVGGSAAIVYPFKCKTLEKHLDTTLPDYAEDKDGFGKWYDKRRALDKTRTRTAMTILGAYLIGMFALIPTGDMLKAAHNSTNLPMVLMLILTAGILCVGVRSSIHNQREFEIDLKRRYPYSRL